MDEKTAIREKFGARIRAYREESSRSMLELAAHLKVAVTYISDLERGTRPPCATDRVRKIAEFLQLDRDQIETLFSVAAETRGHFELPNLERANVVAGQLVMAWPELADDQLTRISGILGERQAARSVFRK
jgi:transcriptional regulator with XRE-family HTH domain